MSYADAFEELSKNNQYGVGAGFDEYTVENLVTPGITGPRQRRGDARRLRRRHPAAGQRHVAAAGQGNPTPNAGYYNALDPGLLMIPRRPTDLYFNVSQPAEWIGGVRRPARGDVQLRPDHRDRQRHRWLRYLLRGENDPWMFHQANLRDNGGGKSLLSDLLDAAFAKYAARATFPVVSPAMDELAERVEARMALDASGVSATIGPGAQAVRARDERGDGAGHRPVHAVRRDLRGPADLVPAARRRPVGHAVARGLQPGRDRYRRRGRQHRRRRQSGTGGAGGSTTIGTLGNGDGVDRRPAPDAGAAAAASGRAGHARRVGAADRARRRRRVAARRRSTR